VFLTTKARPSASSGVSFSTSYSCTFCLLLSKIDRVPVSSPFRSAPSMTDWGNRPDESAYTTVATKATGTQHIS
jgi:hypothetical protein